MKRHLQQESYHRPKCSAALMLSSATCESTGREVMKISHYPSMSWARHQPTGSPGCLRGSAPGSAHCLAFPVLSSLLRITLTLACPMDLKNFPMDVQTCIMQLESCESCARPRFGEETISFPPLLSPAISFPSWNPFPAQPSLEACSRTSCLGFSIHSAHVTFAGEAKPQKIPCEEPWLACVYIGLSLRRREVKVLSAASGIFSLWMNICPLHMLLIPKEGKMMSFFQRKRSSWKK